MTALGDRLRELLPRAQAQYELGARDLGGVPVRTYVVTKWRQIMSEEMDGWSSATDLHPTNAEIVWMLLRTAEEFQAAIELQQEAVEASRR